jgi:hypothetical protein
MHRNLTFVARRTVATALGSPGRLWRRLGLLLGIVLLIHASSGITCAEDPPARTAPTAAPNDNVQEPASDPQGTRTDPIRQIGTMLDRFWQPRREWGDMTVAILKGEPMHPGMGWWRPSGRLYGWEWLAARFDANADGEVEPAELPGPSVWFTRLDRTGDGKLTAEDFDGSSDSAQGSLGGRVFYRLDRDSNGRVTREELAEFFVRADRDEQGYLTPEDFRAALDEPRPAAAPAQHDDEPPALAMLGMLFTGQLGSFREGPAVGEPAIDFALPTHDARGTITLSDSFGKRPVVLVFGSFT